MTAEKNRLDIYDPIRYQITVFVQHTFQKGNSNVTVVVILEVQNLYVQEAPPPTYVQQKLNNLGCCCCVLHLCRHNHITYLYCMWSALSLDGNFQFLSLYIASKIETDNLW